MEKSVKVVKTILPYVVVMIGLYLVYDLFHHMAINVPLAGDDWGYAYEGLNGNPLSLAFSMYFNWSGRFFAELWGYVMAANKSLWDMVNPWLFVWITLTICIGFSSKKNWIISIVVIFGLMVSVDTRLRMETYAWIMGSTYVTALLALLIHLWMVKTMITHGCRYPWLMSIVSALCCLFVGLDMENAAAVALISNGLAIGYLWIKKDKTTIKYMVLPLLISIIAILILRSSPGSAYRLTVDNQAFNQLSLIDKIITNWPNFLHYTFVANPYPLVFLNLSVMVSTSLKWLKNKTDKRLFVYFVIAGLGLLFALSPMLYNRTEINALKVLYDVYYTRSSLWIVTIFYVGYTIALIDYMRLYLDTTHALIGIGLLLLAGISNGVMLISPIFGMRSSLYTIYLLIALDVVMLDAFDQRIYAVGFVCIALLLSIQRISYLKDLYGMIGVRTQRRMMEIDYYQNHPEITEIHITRFPQGTVHSVDVEQGDDYHFDTFKKYYGLNPEASVIFEWDPSDLQ